MRRIAVFARPPIEGRVKTRLSPALPARLACALYRGLLADALAAAGACAADERVVYWAEPAAEATLTPAGFESRLQHGAELGARLERAFDELLAGGAHAAILGADCPALDAARLDEAFAALATHDVALAPASDGGYALVGLARPMPALFRGVAWSTDRVLEQTLERAAAAGASVARLGTLDDLDTPADLARWVARATLEPAAAPATAEALRAMGLLAAGSS